MKLKFALAAASLLALSAAAPQQAAAAKGDAVSPKPARQCFWTHRIDGFAAPNDRVVNVRVGVREVYQFEFLGPCTDIDWAQRIAVVSRGSSHICEGIDAEVIAPSPIGPQRCPVRTVRKLTPAEIKALPKRGRP